MLTFSQGRRDSTDKKTMRPRLFLVAWCGLAGPRLALAAVKTVSPTLDEVTALEEKLQRAYEELERSDYGTRKLVAYARWRHGEPDYQDFLEAGRRAHAAVHSLLDELVLAQINYSMEAASRLSADLSHELAGQLPKAELSRLRQLDAKLQGFHAKLVGVDGQRKMLGYYGTMGSPVLHKNLIGLMETLTQEAELVDRVAKTRGSLGALRGLAERTAQTLTLTRQLLHIGRGGDKARLATFFARAAKDGVPPEKLEGRSFVATLMENVRHFARAEGYTVDIRHRERLTQGLKDATTVNLIVPTHQVPRSDLVLMSHLAEAEDDFLLFAAANDFMPKGKGPLVGKQSFIVDVGRGKEPVKAALAKIQAGLSRNILMYPQAYTSFGYAETRPPVPGFTDFVRALIEGGYKVKVFPVTYETGAPASVEFSHYGLVGRELFDDEKHLVATVHIPWDVDMVRRLVEDKGTNHMRWLLRSQWLSTMPTDEAHVLGQYRLQEFNRRLVKSFGYGLSLSSCRAILRRTLGR